MSVSAVPLYLMYFDPNTSTGMVSLPKMGKFSVLVVTFGILKVASGASDQRTVWCCYPFGITSRLRLSHSLEMVQKHLNYSISLVE